MNLFYPVLRLLGLVKNRGRIQLEVSCNVWCSAAMILVCPEKDVCLD